jgi:uncharacterized repeat protein (TIGR03806 family)
MKSFARIAGILLFASCSHSEKVNVNPHLPPFQKLSEYNFFSGEMKNLSPRKEVLPFEPISALFSDYAYKSRFVWMPEGTAAEYKENGVFNFPEGSVLIKNFYYPFDFRDEKKGREIAETRLLIKRQNGWDALAYIWNKEQTEAFLEIAGGTKKISWINTEGEKITHENYIIPNKNQCKGCHVENGELLPIGPKAKYLNSSLLYPSGEKMNQLEKWEKAGYLSGYIAAIDIERIYDWQNLAGCSVEQRALSYLEINCGTCHNPSGPAKTSGLHLTVEEKNPSNLGLCKSPVAAGRGSGNLMYDIVPGKPEESILVYRMQSTDPGVMMPEMGRKLIHKEGIQLVSEWIKGLQYSCDSIKNSK